MMAVSPKVRLGCAQVLPPPLQCIYTKYSAQCSRRHRRSLASTKSCDFYAPQLQRLTQATALVSPSSCNRTASACASTPVALLGTYDTCGTNYINVGDRGSGRTGSPPGSVARGSSDWNYCFNTVPAQLPSGGPTLVLRSPTDPYMLVGRDTGCTYDFGLTAKQRTSIGAGCLIPGIFITIAVFGGLYMLCAPPPSPRLPFALRCASPLRCALQRCWLAAAPPHRAAAGPPPSRSAAMMQQ